VNCVKYRAGKMTSPERPPAKEFPHTPPTHLQELVLSVKGTHATYSSRRGLINGFGRERLPHFFAQVE